MPEWIPFLQVGVPVLLVAIGLFSGTAIERRHYRSIQERETALRSIPVTNTRSLPEGLDVTRSWLVSGGTVVSVDAFKALLGGFQSFFGGTVTAYEPLVDRARREAVLRLHEEALGADMIVNLRIETSAVGSGGDGEAVSSIEAFAYATALEVRR